MKMYVYLFLLLLLYVDVGFIRCDIVLGCDVIIIGIEVCFLKY